MARGLRGDAAAKLHSHLVEARSFETARAAEEKERVVDFRLVGGLGRSVQTVAIASEVIGSRELITIRCVQISEGLLQGDRRKTANRRDLHPFTSLAAPAHTCKS